MSINDDAKAYITVRHAIFASDPEINTLIQYSVDMTDDTQFVNGYMAVGLRVMHWLEKKKDKSSTGGVPRKKKEGDVEIEYAASTSSSSSGMSWEKVDLKTTSWGRELIEMIRTEVVSFVFPDC